MKLLLWKDVHFAFVAGNQFYTGGGNSIKLYIVTSAPASTDGQDAFWLVVMSTRIVKTLSGGKYGVHLVSNGERAFRYVLSLFLCRAVALELKLYNTATSCILNTLRPQIDITDVWFLKFIVKPTRQIQDEED